MGSRQALLGWVNDLLQTNYSKLDQLGSGAAYCQIMDSIYGDVPMSRVRFDSKTEYDHQQNFKILQAVFTKHSIDRSFDTLRLMKCRLQDNLEFIQWMHKHWEDNAPKGDYDAVARRKAAPGGALPQNSNGTARAASRASTAPSRVSMAPSTASSARRAPSVAASHHPANSGRTTRTTSRATTSRAPSSFAPAQSTSSLRANRVELQRIGELESQIDELEHTINVVTTERTLYFGKLLEIEELMQNRLNELYAQKGDSLSGEDPQVELLRTLQAILYASAEGFETPYRPEDEPF